MDERNNAYSEEAPAHEPSDYIESSPLFDLPSVIRPGDVLASDAADLGYRAADGVLVHAVEGSRLVARDPRTFAMWTRCGRDVSVSDVWASKEPASCPLCAAADPRVEPLDDRADALKQLQLADLAYVRTRARVARLEQQGGNPAALKSALASEHQLEREVWEFEQAYSCLR